MGQLSNLSQSQYFSELLFKVKYTILLKDRSTAAEQKNSSLQHKEGFFW